jgi:pimeloyl-ACP methyl ester carboxylesterase
VLDALRRSGRVSLFFEEAGTVGIPVLLLHELGGSSASWREVIPLFAPDRRVIAVDFRCAGRSEKPIGSFELPISLTISLLCWRLLGVTAPVDVIGAALGSLVGALLAIRHPEREPVHNVRCRRRHGRADPCVCGRARRAQVRVVGMRADRGSKPGEFVSAQSPQAAGRLSRDLATIRLLMPNCR